MRKKIRRPARDFFAGQGIPRRCTLCTPSGKLTPPCGKRSAGKIKRLLLSHTLRYWDESSSLLRGATQFRCRRHPLCPAEGGTALRFRIHPYTPARQMSFPVSRVGGFQPMASFSDRGTAATASASSPIYIYYNYLMRERFGRSISRQSRSPRCRPMMSASAVATLVATGTLWVSQRWMVCISC